MGIHSGCCANRDKTLRYNVPDPTTSNSYCVMTTISAKIDGEWVGVDTSCDVFSKAGTGPG